MIAPIVRYFISYPLSCLTNMESVGIELIDGIAITSTDAMGSAHGEYPIIREFLLVQRERNGGAPSEDSMLTEEHSFMLSDSFSSTQTSALSLGRRYNSAYETPDANVSAGVYSGDMSGPIVPVTIDHFTPIINANSGNLNPAPLISPEPQPMLASPVSARVRRLVVDLEISRGKSMAERESLSDSDSFTRSILVVNAQSIQDPVRWLADRFRRSRKPGRASIDDVVLSHRESDAIHNVNRRSRHSRGQRFKLQDCRQRSPNNNLFQRFLGQLRIMRPEVQVPPLKKSSANERFSSLF
ncbi:hypothetical protein OXX79_004590 [Metschnikowia pulcherrima]